MQAAVYRGKQDVVVQEVPVPELGDGEMMIAVEACCVCGTDLRTYRHGDPKITPPRVLGHEFCGRVVESQANGAAGGVSVGDRVVMYIVLACGRCVYCQDGRANLCVQRTTMSYHHDGAFAPLMRVPAQAVAQRQLFRVESDVSSEHMSLAEPLGCVINAHGRMGVGLRDIVVVIGAGPVGIMHAVVSRLQGAQKVIVVDTAEPRLRLAGNFDVDATLLSDADGGHRQAILELTGGLGPTVVIVACSVAAAQADALEIAGKGARVQFFGGLPKSNPFASLNTNHIHYKELMVTGSYSEKRSDFQAAQALIQGGRFPADKIVTHRAPLAEIHHAFALMESGEALRVCVQPSQP